MECSTAHSSDLELGCNLLCFKAGQIENGKRAGLKEAEHSASCLHLSGYDHQMGDDQDNLESSKEKVCVELPLCY